MIIDSNLLEVQQCLSKILENPASNLEIRTLFPDRTGIEQTDILHRVNRAIEKVLEISLQSESRPILAYRLRFCWIILRKSDVLVKKNGKKIIHKNPPPYNMRNIFQGIIDFKELHDCFLDQLCNMVYLDKDGGFVRYYYDFLSAVKPKQLELPLIGSNGDTLTKNLRRIIWWIIRRNKYRYIEIEGEGLQIHFTPLADDIYKELPKWCNPNEITSIGNLTEEIENGINHWLSYSCLDGENSPTDQHERQEIVKYFINDNGLRHKIKVVSSTKSIEVEEYEREISRFAKENRKLEDEIACLRNQLEASPKEKKTDNQFQDDANNIVIVGLQDFFKNVDSKYSFDVLRSVQLGDSHSITFKNFIDHLFYCLRKKGLLIYPTEDEFDLNYNQSGLYQCIDFEIPSEGTVHVKVEKRGWALVKGERTFPIRKAIVKRK